MNNDCLVSRFKGVIDNETLITLGNTEIHLDKSHGGTFFLATTEEGTFARIFNSSATFSNGTKKIEFYNAHMDTNQLGVTVGNGVMDMEIPLYALKSLKFEPVYGSGDGFSFDLSILKPATEMTTLVFPYSNVTGNIADLAASRLWEWNFYGSNITGNIEDFLPAAIRGLQYIMSLGLQNVKTLSTNFGRTALTGSMKTFLDGLAAVAENGYKISLVQYGANNINYAGTTIDPTSSAAVTIVFDGNGGWTVQS